MADGVVRTPDLPVGVIGGGIVGLAIARRLALEEPAGGVLVLEKEPALAAHQTGHNSGVVHAGIYYPPGSLKAELCARGRDLLREFCQERDIPYEACGKLVVAVQRSELGRLDRLQETATTNRVPGLRRVGPAEMAEVEPHAAGLAALHSPATAITDFVAVARAYAADVEAHGGEVRRGTTVQGVRRRAGHIEVHTDRGPVTVRRLYVCAGLQADRVGVAEADGPRIVPFRGEYMSVVPAKAGLVNGMVYPVPDPRYPFLGVHFTRRVGGGLEVGPNAVLALSREGYRRRDVDLADLRSTLTWPGFWRLARAHWRTGVTEVLGSASTRVYMRRASRYVPAIGHHDVRRDGVGIRAQALERDGSLVDDFRIEEEDGIVAVRNAPSPAATSSLAIAEHVLQRTA